MSAFSGNQHKGAMRDRRKRKDLEARERNSESKPERRRKYRRTHALDGA
jgi:hypothetical protein